MTLDFEPARIQLRELFCHILDRTAHARAGLLPVLAAELVEADGLVVAGRTDVFRDLVELSDRDIENVALVVANFDIVFYRAARFELVYALEYADTVRDMNNIVAAVQFIEAVECVRAFADISLRLSDRRPAGVGKYGYFCQRIFKSRRETAGHNGQRARGQLVRQFVHVECAVAVVYKIAAQRVGGLARAREDNAGAFISVRQRVEVVLENGKRAVPRCYLPCVDADELLYGRVESAARQIVHVYGAHLLIVVQQV